MTGHTWNTDLVQPQALLNEIVIKADFRESVEQLCQDLQPDLSHAFCFDTASHDSVATTENGRFNSDFRSYENQNQSFDDCNNAQRALTLADYTSGKLGIPRDPMQWSPIDVQLWIFEIANQANIASVKLENFNFPGYVLCGLCSADFERLAPGKGLQLKQYFDAYLRDDILQFHDVGSPTNLSNEGGQNGKCIPKQECDVDMEGTCWQWNPGGTESLAESGDFGSTHLKPLHLSLSSSAGFTHGRSSYSDSSPDSLLLQDDDPFVQPYQSPSSNPSGTSASTKDSVLSTSPYSNPQHVHLWQFIRKLLDDPANYSNCIKWLSQAHGIFKIENSSQLAKYWGQRKNRPAMNYDKLSRSLRQYYKKGILQKTPRSQRLVYQFCHPYNL